MIWGECIGLECAFWHRPLCLMLPWRYLKVRNWLGRERGGGQQWDPGLGFTFGGSAWGNSWGIPAVGQGAGKTRPLPPSQLPVPKVQKGLGWWEKAALPWCRSHGTFSLLHMQGFWCLKVTGQLWLCLHHGQGPRTEKLRLFYLCTQPSSPHLIITLKVTNQGWEKYTKTVTSNHLWAVRGEVLFNAFFIFFLYFFTFSKVKQVHFYNNLNRHKKRNVERKWLKTKKKTQS